MTDESLWSSVVPGAAACLLVTVRVMLSWNPDASIAMSAWWFRLIDVSLAAGVCVTVAGYTAHARRLSAKSREAFTKLGEMQSAAGHIEAAEALLVSDFLKSQRNLNQQIIRLSIMLDFSRKLVAAQTMPEAMQCIAAAALKITDADMAVVTVDDSLECLPYVAGGVGRSRQPVARLVSPIERAGVRIGELQVSFTSLGPSRTEASRMIDVMTSFAGVALENLRLYGDLKEANRRLESSRMFAERLLAEVPVGMITLDERYEVITWNRVIAHATGVTAEKAIGRQLADVFNMPEHAVAQLIYDLSRGNGRTDAVTILSEAGEERTFRVAASTSGSVTIMTAEDVTERIRLGEQLKQAERLKSVGMFAASMAHEINNPMGIISACAEVMGKKLDGMGPEFAQQVRTAKIIEDEAMRCSSIIKKWLAFARNADMNAAEVNLVELVDSCLSSLEERARASGVQLHAHGPADGLTIVADPGQLRQVFLNLTINAIEAMPGGGSLSVTAERSGDSAHVVFADTGPGIDEVTLRSLFKPFVTTKPKGTGLGLAVSRGIVECHGGRIEAANGAGGGAVFTVYLPVTARFWGTDTPIDSSVNVH